MAGDAGHGRLVTCIGDAQREGASTPAGTSSLSATACGVDSPGQDGDESGAVDAVTRAGADDCEVPFDDVGDGDAGHSVRLVGAGQALSELRDDGDSALTPVTRSMVEILRVRALVGTSSPTR